MGFRTVSTHGMKTTAKVINFFLLTISSWGYYGLFLQVFRVGFLFSFLNIIFSFSITLFVFLILSFLALSSSLPAPEKRSKGLFHQITKTHGTVIGVSSGIVLVLLIISILVQMKQPRKKVTHHLWVTFCSAGKQTEPEKKRHNWKRLWDSRPEGGTYCSGDREERPPLHTTSK